MPSDKNTNYTKDKSWAEYGSTAFWILLLAASIYWWWRVGGGDPHRLTMIVTLSLAAFVVGCVVGFLFTSYGEESSTVGKIRDWLIAGISGLTLGQLIDKDSALKRVLVTFAAGAGPNEYALVVGSAIMYAGVGFFFMFFQRELIFNVLLAQSRAERGRVEGTRQAGQVTQQLLLTLPVSILSGVDNVDDIVQFGKNEAERLRAQLYSPEVKKFLDEMDSTIKSGLVSDWDLISKVANLHYYRIYFEKDEDKYDQAKIALEWIQRALVINPLHVDLTMKYADALATLDRPEEAVIILERLERTPEAPGYVKHWLGYFLLAIPDRVDESIRYSESYHASYPEESNSLFNVAYGYGEKYSEELRSTGKTTIPHSSNRLKTLSVLKEALAQRPDVAETIRTKWVQKGEMLACFLHDKEFRSLVGLEDETVAA